MPDSRNVTVRLSMDIADYIRSIQAAEKAATQFTKTASGAAQKQAQAWDDLAGFAGKASLGLTAGLAAVVATTANFDQAMSAVAATGDEATASLSALREAAIDAGASTAFSATEAAGGIENLLKAGVTAKDVLAGGLAGALDLAAAGSLDVASAAEFMATSLTQFQLAGDQATHVADLLAAGAGKAQGEVADMANALNYAGVPAANLGVTIEETSGAIALLASNGIIGEQAGTSLRGMLASLTSPSEKASQEMSRLGLSVFDASGKFVGFEGIAGQLQERLGGLTDAERAHALGVIFGNEQLQAANVLYREGADGVQSWMRQVNDAGYAAQTASTRLDNLKGDLEELKGAAETALIGSGEGSEGLLRRVTQNVTGLLNAYNDLPSGVKSAATGFAALTAAVGGTFWVGHKAVGTYRDISDSLATLRTNADNGGGAMRRLGRGAAIAAPALTAVAIAMAETAESDPTASLELVELRVRELATESTSAAKALDELFRRDSSALGGFGGTTDEINGLTDAFRELNRGALDKLWHDRPFMADSWELAEESIADVDAVLAKMVSSGNADEATIAFTRIAGAAHDAGLDSAKLAEIFPKYGDAAKVATESSSSAASSAGELGTAAANAAGDTGDLTEALKAARESAYDGGASFRTLADSLNDNKVSLRGWIDDLAAQGDALRNFTDNMLTLSERGIQEGLLNSLLEAGDEGALRMAQLADATDAELGRANDAWSDGQAAMDSYVAAIDGVVGAIKSIPGDVRTDAHFFDGMARGEIADFKKHLASLDGTTVQTYVRTLISRTPVPGSAVPSTLADMVGGRPGPKRATGGPVFGPGSETSDSIPVWMSHNEHVLSAEEVRGLGGHRRVAEMRAAAREGMFGFATGGRLGPSAGIGTAMATTRPWAMSDTMETIQRAGRLLAREYAENAKGLRGLKRATSAAEKAFDKASDRFDAVRDRRDGVASNVDDLLRRPLFSDGERSAWDGGGAIDPTGILRENLAEIDIFHSARRSLSAKGLDGAALDGLLEQATSLDDVRAMASMSKREVRDFERLYNERESKLRTVSVAAGDAAWGRELKEARRDRQAALDLQRTANRRLDAMEQHLRDAPKKTGKAVSDGVNNAAKNARRNQRRDG